MLTKFFPKLGDNLIVKYLKLGLESKYSAIFITALVLLSNVFSWELPMMYALAGFVVLATLFCGDLLCLIPLACSAYFTFSKVNNPLDTMHTSIFLQKSAQTHLMIIISMIATFVIGRFVFELLTHKERRKFPLLSFGFIALGVSFLLGGLFSKYYDVDTVLFGLTEIAAMSFSYFFFYYTVDWSKVKKSYFAYLMLVMGFLLCGETIGMLYHGGFFSTVGEFNRVTLYTGWGVYNNVAGAMIMCIPAPFYYATVKKKGHWFFLLIGNFFYLTILFIQSRGGMLFGTFVYVACVLLTIWKTKNKRTLLITELSVLLAVVITLIFYQDKIMDIFHSILQSGFNDSGRFKIYWDGFKQFLDNPIFGNGFYACQSLRWGDNSIGLFLPARYHNTVIQLLASGGVVSLLAYGYHRFQTLRMIFKKRSVEKYFIGMCILGLLLTSLLDCHFFNFGPGFTYSALLLFLEMDWLREEPKENTSLAISAEETYEQPQIALSFEEIENSI